MAWAGVRIRLFKNKNDIPPKLAGFRANIALTASLKAN